MNFNSRMNMTFLTCTSPENDNLVTFLRLNAIKAGTEKNIE